MWSPSRWRQHLFSSPGLYPWRAYVVTQSLAMASVSASASLLAQCFKFSKVCIFFLSHLLVAGCDIGVRFSVRPSVRLSTFMSTFDIYVKVSILINYKTKQPSNLAWNISLTSWLCDIGVHFSVRLSIHPSICQHLCRSSTFMSKLVF